MFYFCLTHSFASGCQMVEKKKEESLFSVSAHLQTCLPILSSASQHFSTLAHISHEQLAPVTTSPVKWTFLLQLRRLSLFVFLSCGEGELFPWRPVFLLQPRPELVSPQSSATVWAFSADVGVLDCSVTMPGACLVPKSCPRRNWSALNQQRCSAPIQTLPETQRLQLFMQNCKGPPSQWSTREGLL